MRVCVGVVLNWRSGKEKKQAVAEQIRHLFGKRCDLHLFLAERGEVQAAMRKALAEGVNILVAGGGDGTVSAAASMLVNSPVILGVLPLGTLNHFARDLQIPTGLAEAVEVILSGKELQIDAGEVNGHLFVNNSSLGIYPHIVRHREFWEKTGYNRLLAFTAAILLAFRRWPFLDLSVRVHGQTIVRRSPFLFVGNNHYEMEGLRLGSRGCLNGGKLSLFTAHKAGRWGLLRIAFSALLHRLKRTQDFETLEAEELLIGSRRKFLSVALDGEVVRIKSPLRYRILPGALRVMVPSHL